MDYGKEKENWGEDNLSPLAEIKDRSKIFCPRSLLLEECERLSDDGLLQYPPAKTCNDDTAQPANSGALLLRPSRQPPVIASSIAMARQHKSDPTKDVDKYGRPSPNVVALSLPLYL